MRKLPFIILFLAVASALASFAKADTLTLDSGIVNDGQFFVGPVNMTLNGTNPILAMCISINSESSFGSTWNVKEYSLGGNLTGFSLFDGTAQSFRNLQEVAYLYGETLIPGQTTAQIASDNKAAWILEKGSDSSHDSYLFDAGSAAALQNAQSQTFNTAFNNSFVFYQPTDSTNQIFVGLGHPSIPEPGTYAIAFLGLVGFTFWRRTTA